MLLDLARTAQDCLCGPKMSCLVWYRKRLSNRPPLVGFTRDLGIDAASRESTVDSQAIIVGVEGDRLDVHTSRGVNLSELRRYSGVVRLSDRDRNIHNDSSFSLTARCCL